MLLTQRREPILRKTLQSVSPIGAMSSAAGGVPSLAGGEPSSSLQYITVSALSLSPALLCFITEFEHQRCALMV